MILEQSPFSFAAFGASGGCVGRRRRVYRCSSGEDAIAVEHSGRIDDVERKESCSAWNAHRCSSGDGAIAMDAAMTRRAVPSWLPGRRLDVDDDVGQFGVALHQSILDDVGDVVRVREGRVGREPHVQIEKHVIQ